MEDKLVNDVAMITCPVCWAAIKDKDGNWTRHRKWHETLDEDLGQLRKQSAGGYLVG